jgi:transposase
MTDRCIAAVQHLGLFVNGEGGVRLGQRIGITTSPTTLLRRVMDLPDPDFPAPIRIGLDDWSYRRRKRFGTILVDHDLRCVIDLLPDTEVPTVAGWLRKRPSVRRISRDRSNEFATAVAEGAPQAIQVLDRWHLLKNLTDLLPTILAPSVRRLRPTQVPVLPPEPDYPDPTQWKPDASPSVETKRLAHQQERNAQYDRMLALRQQGFTVPQIAQQMAMSKRTVTRWLASFRRDTRQRKRRSIFDPYATYVLTRWQQGCRNGAQIYRELVQQGFPGSERFVYRFLHALRRQGHQAIAAMPSPETLSPVQRYTLTQLVWLLVRFPTELSEAERQDVAWFCEADPIIASAAELVQALRRLLRTRQEGQLAAWATACEVSPIPELHRFVRHLRQEWPQAVAASTQPESQGLVEGFITKLKLIKRQTYGRAGFLLLRKRVLHMEAC